MNEIYYIIKNRTHDILVRILVWLIGEVFVGWSLNTEVVYQELKDYEFEFVKKYKICKKIDSKFYELNVERSKIFKNYTDV